MKHYKEKILNILNESEDITYQKHQERGDKMADITEIKRMTWGICKQPYVN